MSKSLFSTKQIEQAILQQCSILFSPSQVFEIRALDVQRSRHSRPHTESGFFDTDHLAQMAKAAAEVSLLAKGTYFTLNPVKIDLLARRWNRMGWAKEGELTSDTDILRRQCFLVDVDPVRDRHLSATQDEKKYARDVIDVIRAHLDTRHWPVPIFCDSGNGYHLLYRIDLPCDDGGLVARILKSLAQQFDTEHAKLDQKVFNPARICKLPGSISRKGDHTPQRPHRQARILEYPACQ
jgi:hypothetical protein